MINVESFLQKVFFVFGLSCWFSWVLCMDPPSPKDRLSVWFLMHGYSQEVQASPPSFGLITNEGDNSISTFTRFRILKPLSFEFIDQSIARFHACVSS